MASNLGKRSVGKLLGFAPTRIPTLLELLADVEATR
jgi:hypothetical protein